MPIQFNSHNHNDNNAIDYNEYSPAISDLAICTIGIDDPSGSMINHDKSLLNMVMSPCEPVQPQLKQQYHYVAPRVLS